MPRICSFYGITIAMFYNEHEPPHFHAEYGEHQARFRIDTLEAMDSGFPRRGLRLVHEWSSLHQQELNSNWIKARLGWPLDRIDPLP